MEIVEYFYFILFLFYRWDFDLGNFDKKKNKENGAKGNEGIFSEKEKEKKDKYEKIKNIFDEDDDN